MADIEIFQGHPDRGLALISVTTLLVTMAATTVTVRLIARFIILHTSGMDDWCAMASMIASIGTLISINIGVSHGTGKAEPSRDIDAVALGKIQLATQILYTVSSGLIKVSILFFYRRIFQDLNKLIIITMVFIIAMSIAFIFAAIFQCEPVGTLWLTGDEGRLSCFPALGFWCNVAVIFLLTDIWIMVLPLKLIFGLHLVWEKKFAVIGLLCSTGLFTIVAAAVRLAYVVHLYKGHDPSWDSVPIYYCSIVEISIALVACSIPPLRSAWPNGMERFRSWRKKTTEVGSSSCTA